MNINYTSVHCSTLIYFLSLHRWVGFSQTALVTGATKNHQGDDVILESGLDLCFEVRVWFLLIFMPNQLKSCGHVATSQKICRENQSTGLYTMATSAFNDLKIVLGLLSSLLSICSLLWFIMNSLPNRGLGVMLLMWFWILTNFLSSYHQ